MILSSPNSFLASSTDISSCPICTPSASTASATSILSLITNGTLYFAASSFISFASLINSSCERFFSRSCKNVIPPSNASSTCSIKVFFLAHALSVTAYNVIVSASTLNLIAPFHPFLINITHCIHKMHLKCSGSFCIFLGIFTTDSHRRNCCSCCF